MAWHGMGSGTKVGPNDFFLRLRFASATAPWAQHATWFIYLQYLHTVCVPSTPLTMYKHTSADLQFSHQPASQPARYILNAMPMGMDGHGWAWGVFIYSSMFFFFFFFFSNHPPPYICTVPTDRSVGRSVGRSVDVLI